MYDYKNERQGIFSDTGQRDFCKCLLCVMQLLDDAGSFKLFFALKPLGSYDTWYGMALVDRMVELGLIREVTKSDVIAQDRVFIADKL